MHDVIRAHVKGGSYPPFFVFDRRNNSTEPLITIALTGGVGTGKSTAVRLFMEVLGERAQYFDCDAAVHELLTKSPIIGTLSKVFGEDILSSDGQIDREILRDLVFDDTAQRRKLESILHPEVLESAREAHREASRKSPPPELFIHDVPLLYESDFPIERDFDLVIAASRETQSQRLQDHRGLSEPIIDKIIDSQMPLARKIERAGLVIWNDGTESELHEQAHLAVNSLKASLS